MLRMVSSISSNWPTLACVASGSLPLPVIDAPFQQAFCISPVGPTPLCSSRFRPLPYPPQHTIRQLHFRNISNEFRFSIIFLLFFSYTPYIAILFSSFYFRFRIFFVRRFLHTVCPQRDHPHCRIVRNFRKTIETHSKVVENCKTEKQPNRKTAERNKRAAWRLSYDPWMRNRRLRLPAISCCRYSRYCRSAGSATP